MTFTIGRRAWSAGAADAMGNVQPVWATAVDVYATSIYATSVEELPANAREANHTYVTVLLPSGSGFDRRDLAVVQGVEFDVDGDLETFATGPYGYDAGDRLSLSRVEG